MCRGCRTLCLYSVVDDSSGAAAKYTHIKAKTPVYGTGAFIFVKTVVAASGESRTGRSVPDPPPDPMHYLLSGILHVTFYFHIGHLFLPHGPGLPHALTHNPFVLSNEG